MRPRRRDPAGEVRPGFHRLRVSEVQRAAADDLLKAAYAAIKAADPDAVVIAGVVAAVAAVVALAIPRTPPETTGTATAEDLPETPAVGARTA